jgi:hypothetical protein
LQKLAGHFVQGFPTAMEHITDNNVALNPQVTEQFKRLQQSTLNTFANSSVGFKYQLIHSS